MSDLLVIFDFDGTLADTWDLFAAELVVGAGPLGYKQLDRAEIEALRSMETKAIFRSLDIRWWRLPRVVAHLRRRAEALADQVRLFSGMAEVVTTLANAGHELAVVSSNSEATVRRVLGRDLDGHIRHFDCSSSVFGKAAKFKVLRRRAGRPSVVAVGDESRDLDAAAKAGLAGLAVEWGYNDPALLRRLAPGRTAASPDDLLALLAKYAAPRG